MSAAAFLPLLGCVLCYTAQNYFNLLYSVSYPGAPADATPVFSIIYGLFTALVTLAVSSFSFQPSADTVLCGLLCGAALFLFNLSLINASVTGPYGFQTIMKLMGSVILPLAFCTLVWRERLTAAEIIGLAVMLLGFVLFNLKGLKAVGVKKGYYLWSVLLFTANGAYGILMDAQQKLAGAAQRNEMIVITFAGMALLSIVIQLIRDKSVLATPFKLQRKAAPCLVACCAVAATAVHLMMYTLSLIPATILFATNNGGVLIATTLLGAAATHEKLDRFKLAGLAVCAAGLALLSI